MKNVILGCFAALVMTTGTAQGALVLATDDFTYPDGDLVPNGGWEAHSGTTTPIQVVSGAVEMSHGSGSREDANIAFAEQTSGIVSFSIDVTVQDESPSDGTDYEYFAHFMDQGGSFTARLDAVTTGNNFTFGISTFSSTADVVLTSVFNYGDTVSLLVGYDLDTGIASLTVGSETISGVVNSNSVNINQFALRQSNSSGDETILIDNLLVTGTAVPEPSSLALVGFGLVGLLSRRRRKTA